ncbi:MAG: hypothetical protein ACLTWO_05865 [Blautia massiliensis (ex Durand et al. 2017)]
MDFKNVHSGLFLAIFISYDVPRRGTLAKWLFRVSVAADFHGGAAKPQIVFRQDISGFRLSAMLYGLIPLYNVGLNGFAPSELFTPGHSKTQKQVCALYGVPCGRRNTIGVFAVVREPTTLPWQFF